jgi:hypothetical protein
MGVDDSVELREEGYLDNRICDALFQAGSPAPRSALTTGRFDDQE